MIEKPNKNDGPSIVAVAANSGVFSAEEVDCVQELWDEARQSGEEASGYYFLVDRREGEVAGFACYGPRALTQGTYDLYWIATAPQHRRKGVGQALLVAVEAAVADLGGRLIIVETSGLPKYAPTRAFYLATDYVLEAQLRDFYALGDDMVIFTKHLSSK
jgi:GNAT superfamily N-acetyltransferase